MSVTSSSSLEGSITYPLTPFNKSKSDLDIKVQKSVKAPWKLVRYNAFYFDGDSEEFENFFNARAAHRSQS